jgi:hypothetical protein
MEYHCFVMNEFDRKNKACDTNSQVIRKLLSAKAMREAADSRKLSQADLKRMVQRMKQKPGNLFDVDNYLLPFGVL